MIIEVLGFVECPYSAAAIELVRRCMHQLGIDAPITVRDGDYPSPTICVNGIDVMGDTPAESRACRVDVPTEERVMAALRRAKDR